MDDAFYCNLTLREVVVLASLVEKPPPRIVLSWLDAQGLGGVEADGVADRSTALAEAAASLWNRGLLVREGTKAVVSAPLERAIDVLLAPTWSLTVFSASRGRSGLDFEICGGPDAAVMVATDGVAGATINLRTDVLPSVERALRWVQHTTAELVPDPGIGEASTVSPLFAALGDRDWALVAIGDAGERGPDLVWLRSEHGQHLLTPDGGSDGTATPISDDDLWDVMWESAVAAVGHG